MMRVFKTKEFWRFGRRERISDRMLCDAVARAERGLIDADLGGGLIKQRVARQGQGRSGGFRTLLGYRTHARSVFLYGFAKSERGNIDPDEAVLWRQVAVAALATSTIALEAALETGEMIEVPCDGKV